MNTINPIIDLDSIESIAIGDGTYGDDINSRFETINSNFQKILETEYLVGAEGKSIGLRECRLTNTGTEIQKYDDLYYYDGTKVTSYNLYMLVYDCITKKYQENPDVLASISDINWFDGINGTSIYMMYETVNGKNYLISSLPYTHIDARYKRLKDQINNSSEYYSTQDTSSIIQYQTVSKNGSRVGEFNSIQAFPTIYYNSDKRDFCWNINGQQTDLTCKGMDGKNGQNGSLYITYVDKVTNSILCVLNYDSGNASYQHIKPSDFVRCGINIQDNDVVICFYAVQTDTGFELIPDTDTDGNDTYSTTTYFLTNAIVDEYQEIDQKYKVYIGDDTCSVTTRLDMVTMYGLFDKIGLIDGCPTGLYIPYITEGNSLKGHMLWEEYVNGSRLNIALVNNVHSKSPESLKSGSIMIDYPNISLNGDVKVETKMETPEALVSNKLEVTGEEASQIKNLHAENLHAEALNSDSLTTTNLTINQDTINLPNIVNDKVETKEIVSSAAQIDTLKIKKGTIYEDILSLVNSTQSTSKTQQFYNNFHNSLPAFYSGSAGTIGTIKNATQISINNLEKKEHIVQNAYSGQGGESPDAYIFNLSAQASLMLNNQVERLTYIISNISGVTCTVYVSNNKICDLKDHQKVYLQFTTKIGAAGNPDYIHSGALDI